MGRVKQILVAVDRFPQNQAALARAVELARIHGANLTVLHVAGDLSGRDAPGLDATERHLLEEQALALARDRVENAIRTHDPGPVPVDIRVEAGSPPSRVVEVSKDLGADLIVLRAHQRRSIRDKVIGTTADRIIRATPASVLIVKRPVERGYRNVVIAVDNSDVSEATAILSAKLCPGATVQLVHVTQISPQFEQALLRVGTSQARMAAFRRVLADKAWDRMRGLAASLAGPDPAPHVRVIEGEPAKSLVRLTWTRSVDLIAVGPYEHGVIRLALLGSVTQRLLRDAACDVLISRPPQSMVNTKER